MIGKRIGNYIIERTLAQGGMGAVFVARDQALGRQAAIKFVGHDPECTEDIARRFLDEARITANLQHPNVVTIFDYGEFEGRLYYVMELLAGNDLATLMGSTGRFATRYVGLLLEQICSGLHAAHATGVVHRDLKPSNIFVLGGEPLRTTRPCSCLIRIPRLSCFSPRKNPSNDGIHRCSGWISRRLAYLETCLPWRQRRSLGSGRQTTRAAPCFQR